MLTIEPGWWPRMYFSACLVPRKTESTLTLITFFQSSKERLSMSPPRLTPALLTSTEMPPMASSASSSAKTHCSSLVTSSGKAKATPSPCAAFSSAATALAPSRLMSATDTLAPSAASLRAMAAPSPCAPPVMKAFLPATRPAMSELPSCLLRGRSRGLFLWSGKPGLRLLRARRIDGPALQRRRVDELRHFHVELGHAAGVVSGQQDVDLAVDIAPLRMVVELLGLHGDPAHEAEGAAEIAEHHLAADGVALARRGDPDRQALQRLDGADLLRSAHSTTSAPNDKPVASASSASV